VPSQHSNERFAFNILKVDGERLKQGLALGVLLHNLLRTTMMHNPPTHRETTLTMFARVRNPSFEKVISTQLLDV